MCREPDARIRVLRMSGVAAVEPGFEDDRTRDAGKHLAFFSGNEVYWKTRFEPSADGSATPYRTLVCYKEGKVKANHAFAKGGLSDDKIDAVVKASCALVE